MLVTACTLVGLIAFECRTPQPQVSQARLCGVAQIIRYSRNDTAETRLQLRAHNARFRAACGDR